MNIEKKYSKKSYKQSWVVCMTAALYFFYLFLQMTKFNAIGDSLMKSFNLGNAGLGALSSGYFWGNVAFLLPAGLLLDRFSTKKILGIVMMGTIFATFLFTYSCSFNVLFWCSIIIGITGSFALLIPLRLAARWFPSEKLAQVSGLVVTIGFLGAIFSQSPLTYLVINFGWKFAMYVNVALGIIFFIIMMIFVKDFPKGTTSEMTKEQATSVKFLIYSLKKALSNPQNWIFGSYTCLVNLAVFIYGAVFGISFLTQIHGLSITEASFVLLSMFLGAMIGSPVLGWVSDKLQRRKLPMLVCGFISFFLLLLPMYITPMNKYLAYFIFLNIGFFISAQVITYPVIAETNSPENIGAGLSLGSILIMGGGAVFLPIFGYLLNTMLLNNSVFYSFKMSLWILPITCLIGTIGLFFGKETKCKSIFK